MRKDEIRNLNRGTAHIVDGFSSKAIVGLVGCENCPHRRSCAVYDPLSHANKVGCAARQKYLVDVRREIGNVDSNLMGRAVVLREELESEAALIRKSGESPIQNKAWRDAYKTDLELAKFLVRMKYGSKQTIRVEKEPEEFIIVSEEAQVKEDKDEKDT